MYTSRPCALGRKQSNEGLGDCLQKTSCEDVGGGLVPPPPPFYNSSYFILLERRVGVGFTELFFASTASLKNLKIDGKLFQEVSSWRSVPAETRGQSGSMDSTEVSRGSELDTQLQQFCKSRQFLGKPKSQSKNRIQTF